MTTVVKDPYIFYKDDILTPEFCNHCIEKFENDRRPIPGQTSGGLDTTIKDSLDLRITALEDWTLEDNIFADNLQFCLDQYTNHLNKNIALIDRTTVSPKNMNPFNGAMGLSISDSGYQIQKTKPGTGYVWHNDFEVNNQNGIRYLTFIFYLNDVREGWTQFDSGQQVEPKQGRVLLFPSTWTYTHQGYPPKDTKYLVTGWIHLSIENMK